MEFSQFHFWFGPLVCIHSFIWKLQFYLGITYDISNKHRLGYSEVELVQKMIDGVNTLWKEDKELVAKQEAA